VIGALGRCESEHLAQGYSDRSRLRRDDSRSGKSSEYISLDRKIRGHYGQAARKRLEDGVRHPLCPAAVEEDIGGRVQLLYVPARGERSHCRISLEQIAGGVARVLTNDREEYEPKL
jgi:hypothetical protein